MKEIAFNCLHCDTRLRVDYNEAGLQAKCPSCNRVITIPGPPVGPVTNNISKESRSNFGNSRFRFQPILIICITLLWAIIHEIYLTDDGVVYFKQKFSQFLINVALFAIGSFALFGLISFIALGVVRLFRKSKQFLGFEKVYIYTVLILGTLIVLGKENKEGAKIQNNSQALIESKPKDPRHEQNTPIEKLGESEFYYSTLDSFTSYFPTKPTILSARSAGLEFRSYQALETFVKQGFIFYSVTFSNNTSKSSFADSAEEAKRFLFSTLEEFRKTLSSNSKRRVSPHFGTFLDRYAVEYKIYFTQDTIYCINQGVFLLDKQRIIRISLSYPEDVEQLGSIKFHKFKNYFGLIER